MKGTILTYLLVAFGILGSIRRPTIGLYVYIAFSLLRPQALWGYTMSIGAVSQIVAVAMLVFWGLHGFGSWRFGRATSIVGALLFFLLWSWLSSLQAEDTRLATISVVEWLKIVMPFLVGVTLLKSEKDVRTLLWVIVLVQAYIGLEMNWSYLGGYNRAEMEGFGGMDNNSFGISLVTTFGAAVGLALTAETWKARIAASVSTALILHTILLTFSRGAFVGLIAVGIVAVGLMPKRPKYLGSVAAVAILALWLTGPELAQRYGTTFAAENERDASAESRVQLWQDCLVVLAARPVFGVGPLNFPVVSSEFGWPEGKQAHSVWFQTAAEVGAPGILALILFYAITAGKLWPIARKKRPDISRSTATLATAIILSIAGYVVSAQFVSLEGLEVPVYIAMAGAVLLKSLSPALAPATQPAGKLAFARARGSLTDRSAL